MDEVRDALLRGADDPDGTDPVEVCTASIDDWNRYVQSSYHAMKPNLMEGRDGKIWIVEYAGTIHSQAACAIIAAMLNATGTLNGHLAGFTDPHNEEPPPGQPQAEPGCSFGPRSDIGAVLPPGGANFLEFQTVKAEIGVSQGWRGLDHNRQFGGDIPEWSMWCRYGYHRVYEFASTDSSSG
ncbi:hypothetical protein PRIC1_005732 [Phytophthora ramorum]